MHYIILHGTGCTPDDHRFPRLRKELEDRGHEVSIPALPHADKPNWQERSSFVVENYLLDSQTVLVGHSSGATAILSILEQIHQPIAKALLVSGFFVELDKAGRAKLMLQDQYDREKIQHSVAEIIFINSDNDPRGCTDVQARPVAERLGGQLVVATGKGHMGSGTFNDPCEQLPLLCNYL